ncbi:MAG TPA: MFS transporter, partial [Chloroflexota bacterium]
IALPNGVALVREVVPEQRRAASFGLVGAVVSIAAAAGPPLGGVLVSTAGWQAIFYMNVPIVLAAFLLGWRVLPRHTVTRHGQSFDLLGAILLCSVLVGVSLLLRAIGVASLPPLLLAGGVLLLLAVLFVIRELHHPEPVFHPHFFLRRSFAAATAAVALSNLAMYSIILALPVILTRQAHWTSGHIGLVLTALSAVNVICTPFGGRLADRFGRRAPVVGGLTLFTLALLPLLREAPGWSGLVLTLSLAVAGAGLGIANPGMQTAAVEAVAAREAGAASGMYSTSRYLGSIVGSSVLPILLTASAPTTADVRHMFVLIILAAGCSAAVSLALHGKPRS